MMLFRNQRNFGIISDLFLMSKSGVSHRARQPQNARILRKRKVTEDEKRNAKLTKRALEHFDRFYPPYYQNLWKSMRIALLSEQKYCAVINNFACKDEAIAELIENGADNMIHLSQHYETVMQDDETSLKEDEISVMTFMNESPPWTDMDEDEAVEHGVPTGHDARLYSFMPAQRVYSESEEMGRKEFQQNILNTYEQEVLITGDEEKPLPHYLQVFAHPMGEVYRFPEPDVDKSGKFEYYLMDAGAVVPVLALGISPGDKVLDICAAPGEKAMTILQTLLTGSLTCVDHSYARMKELKEKVKWYLPKSFEEDKKFNIIHADATTISKQSKHTGKYDKVLVDVPSFDDREAVQFAEERIFSAGNQEIRIRLQESQARLLIAGILCCKPGGSIVYSTSTLSPPQNDGVIQQVLEYFQNEEQDIKLLIQNTKHLCSRLNNFMHFYDKCRFGQLVIPKLTANYGPAYFCKLKRIN